MNVPTPTIVVISSALYRYTCLIDIMVILVLNNLVCTNLGIVSICSIAFLPPSGGDVIATVSGSEFLLLTL